MILKYIYVILVYFDIIHNNKTDKAVLNKHLTEWNLSLSAQTYGHVGCGRQ